MKIFGTHVYLGNPDAGMSAQDKQKQESIRQTEGPQTLFGLVSYGDKSRRSILEGSNKPPRNGKTSTASDAPNQPAHIEKLAKTAFGYHLYYQGTTASEAKRAREQGMDPARKTSTSAEKMSLLPLANIWPISKFVEKERERAMQHVYFTPRKHLDGDAPGATEYACFRATDEDAAEIVRAYFDDRAILELGLEGDAPSGGLRTRQAIPAGYFLPPQGSPVEVSPASEAFMHQFNHDAKNRQKLGIDKVIDSREAAALMQQVLDSLPKDEFPKLKGKWAKLETRTRAHPEPSEKKVEAPAFERLKLDEDALKPLVIDFDHLDR